MYSSRLYLFIFFLIFFSRSWVHAVCYYPDKSIVPNYQACNPKSDNGSACCELSSSVCTTKGYCFGSISVLYRGGCTDPEWRSPNCAQQCLNGTLRPLKTILRDPSLNINCILVAHNSFSNILPCSNGVYTDTFCCAGWGSKTSCCDNSFGFDAGHPYVPLSTSHLKTSTSTLTKSSSTTMSLNIQICSSILASTNTALSGASAPSPSISTLFNAQIPSSILASTNKDLSRTLAASATPLAHTDSKSLTAIGLGIGLPFGLLFLLSVGFLFYRERRRQTMMENLRRQIELLQRQPRDGHSIVSSSTLGPSELEHINRPPGELDSQSPQIYEAAANSERTVIRN